MRLKNKNIRRLSAERNQDGNSLVRQDDKKEHFKSVIMPKANDLEDDNSTIDYEEMSNMWASQQRNSNRYPIHIDHYDKALGIKMRVSVKKPPIEMRTTRRAEKQQS